MPSSAFASPLIVTPNGEATALKRVPLSSGQGEHEYDEKFIQDIAFEHPDCLPVAEIDRAYENLIPVCTELSTPAGPLDVLYVTPTGRLVIVEAKLWRNPEARRKVVAQILDYAKELSRWSYEDLQREVSRRLGRAGNVLYELVARDYPDTSEARFVDEVHSSLRRGRFLLLIVGDGIREGAGAITDFLENVGTLEFTFGLVELALYSGAIEGLLVQPRVVARTVELKRTVISLASDDLRVTESGDDAVPVDDKLTKTQEFYSGFWSEFLEGLRLDDTTQPMPNVTKQGNIFFAMPPSAGAAWVTVYFSQQDSSVGLFLTFKRGNFADTAYEKLLSDRDTIDTELDLPVEWQADDGKYRILLSRRFDGIHEDKNRVDIKAFLADAANRFVNVFRPRMERIANQLDER